MTQLPEQKINKIKDYERLEFLGDAVLELVSSHFLFMNHLDMNEGQMTKLRSSMVCEPALAYCARDLSLDQYILLGKGEELTGGRDRDSITSDVCEAVIGAIYLDGGFAKAEGFKVMPLSANAIIWSCLFFLSNGKILPSKRKSKRSLILLVAKYLFT